MRKWVVREPEGFSTAYATYWHYRHEKKGPDIPIVFVGYSQLRMGDIPSKERSTIIRAAERGYRMQDATPAIRLLDYIREAQPKETKTPIGYIGKRHMTLYLPNALAEDLAGALRGHVIMSDKMSESKIRLFSAADHPTFMQIRVSLESGRKKGSQLKAAFTEMRTMIGEYMEAWKDLRLPLLDFVTDDDSLVQVPFRTDKRAKEK